MSETVLQHDAGFDYIFDAATEGLRIQSQIDNYVRRSTEIIDSIGRRMAVEFSDSEIDSMPVDPSLPVGTSDEAAEGFGMMAIASQFTDTLKAKEKTLDDELEGTPLSIRVLSGEGRKLITRTYFSTGLTGSWQQEYGLVDSTHKNGTYRAALLGQNALVLFPRFMSGDQLDNRNIVVPILREDGEPNIAIRVRERSWRDRIGILPSGAPLGSNARYQNRNEHDMARLRVLATML